MNRRPGVFSAVKRVLLQSVIVKQGDEPKGKAFQALITFCMVFSNNVQSTNNGGKLESRGKSVKDEQKVSIQMKNLWM